MLILLTIFYWQGHFEDDNFNGVGTMRHCSGLTYHGIWSNGNPTVLPTKLVIINETGKEVMEFIQGQPFDLKVQCVNDNGEIIEGNKFSTCNYRYTISISED